jgi:hypothetical protein
MSSIDNNLFFKFCFISISILFGFYFLNDLDIDSQYFSNIYADEISANKDDSYYYGKDRIDMNYVVDSSEYFEEDNVPQNNNIINSNYNNNRNNNNNNNQLILQQQLEEQQIRQQQGQVYNQIKNKKYEFISIESKNDKNYDIKSDYVTFKTVLNLQNIEKTGFIRLVGYINGQSFKEDIQLSELAPSTVNKLDVKLKVLKDTKLVSLDSPDEFFVCAYHLKDLEKEYNSILNYDCNEVDVQSSDGTNTVRLFKLSSMKYSDSKALYDEQQQKGQGQDSKKDDKVLLKIISPLGDRKKTKELKIAVAIRGQIQTEMIQDVQKELAKSKDDTITRTFTFDRKTDLGNIQIGDLFSACVSSDELNPPEGQECEKRLVKKFNSPNSLPAR